MNTEVQLEKQKDAKPSRSKIWIRRGLELLLFIIVIMGVRAWQHRNIDIGEPAAPLSGKLLDGKSYALPARPAQPVLVHFWATWCPTCRAEQGSIESLFHDNPNVITVASWSETDAAVQKYLQEHALTFPVLNDADGIIAKQWKVSGVPASFIIDREGKVRFVEIGYTTGIGLRIRLWLASL